MKVLNDKNIAEQFIQNGLENIKRFNPKVIFEQWNYFLQTEVK